MKDVARSKKAPATFNHICLDHICFDLIYFYFPTIYNFVHYTGVCCHSSLSIYAFIFFILSYLTCYNLTCIFMYQYKPCFYIKFHLFSFLLFSTANTVLVCVWPIVSFVTYNFSREKKRLSNIVSQSSQFVDTGVPISPFSFFSLQ